MIAPIHFAVQAIASRWLSGVRDLAVSPDGSSLAIATEDSVRFVRLADIIQQP